MTTAKLINLEWDEINIHDYATFDEALALANAEGKRLPTPAEWQRLLRLPGYWSKKYRGRIMGKYRWQLWRKGLFLPACGYVSSKRQYRHFSGVHGYYWSDYYWSDTRKGDSFAYYQSFGAEGSQQPDFAYVGNKLSVRLVKDI
jgi:uncharacterized protein (TIGR02145 family)